MIDLLKMYARLLIETDPLIQVRRDVNAFTNEANLLSEQALMSGAMPNEFTIIGKFKPVGPFGAMRLTPTLSA